LLPHSAQNKDKDFIESTNSIKAKERGRRHQNESNGKYSHNKRVTVTAAAAISNVHSFSTKPAAHSFSLSIALGTTLNE